MGRILGLRFSGKKAAVFFKVEGFEYFGRIRGKEGGLSIVQAEIVFRYGYKVFSAVL